MSKPNLIYIVGNGRSGSTILATLLAEMQGCVTVGETGSIWFVPEGQQFCGCGKPYDECELWEPVLQEYMRLKNPLDIPFEKRKLFHNKDLNLPLLLGLASSIPHELVEITTRLFRGILAETGATTIIDESKNLTYFNIVKKTNLFNLRVVHIVRDPRAVAFSWQRAKNFQRDSRLVDSAPRYFKRSYHRTAFNWFGKQFILWMTRAFIPPERYLIFRYEDFVQNPRQYYENACTNLGLTGASPFVNQWDFNCTNIHHLIASNPSTAKPGLNNIRIDQEWLNTMPTWAKLLVTLICWPMLLAYGYPIIPELQHKI